MEYDAIVVGGSFAGLAVTGELDGNILLIERKEIGEGQTSACGSLYRTVQELNCEESVLQTFDEVVIHIPREERIELTEPWCTIDYKVFCQILARRVGARKLRANVKGVKGRTVITNNGSFQSECIVDCTGWRAVLASSLRKGFVDKEKLMFGIETVADYRDDALHFFVDPKIIQQGAAWIFPVKEKSRIGVLSYSGETDLMPRLKTFLGSMGLSAGRIHGNYIPYGLREPVVDNIFLVGDAAGQATPLFGEGIRKSIYFGKKCGRIIQEIIDKEITLNQGLEEYKDFVKKSEGSYNFLLALQNKFVLEGRPPDFLVEAIGYKDLSKLLQEMYIRI